MRAHGQSPPECSSDTEAAPKRGSSLDVCELIVGFALILAVIWTEQPLQRWLYYAAIGWFSLSILSTFPGWKTMGCCTSGFWRSLWVIAVALLITVTATAIAVCLHTLHHPGGPSEWIETFGGYTIWALTQQFLLQGYFLVRLLRVFPNPTVAAAIAAVVFAIAHLPNPILTPITLFWGLVACLVFMRSRNIFPLAIAHAICGICIAVTIPASILHNMRVGLGYITYQEPHQLHLSHAGSSARTTQGE
jgi:membrane protease YdiL (CAAX protease family)